MAMRTTIATITKNRLSFTYCSAIAITTFVRLTLSSSVLFPPSKAFSINHDIAHNISNNKNKQAKIMTTTTPRPNQPISPSITASINKINDIITTDAGGRGMTHLVVPGDLLASAKLLARLTAKSKSRPRDPPSRNDDDGDDGGDDDPLVIILSGFPCCVAHAPPTETDGPPGAWAIAAAASNLGHRVVLVTDRCNEDVFRASAPEHKLDDADDSKWELITFPPEEDMTEDQSQRLRALARKADLIIACERAGPASDGKCYTMRGIDMNEKGLIAPLHRIVEMARERNNGGGRVGDDDDEANVKFIAVGDGGNEMGMGKVLGKIHEHIPNGKLIGAVTEADHLIAASVSNWGGYALAAAAALVRCSDELDGSDDDEKEARAKWVERCVPTEGGEVKLLERCVAAGCRDGVSGKMEATVDGMPLETSMKCLRDIREAALIP
mmetsp:Transcript_1940/g.4222  ORF Transcript_1940/g.4222 Transcript_1940/m.4222 type:complete len:440 (-) Transcript_1940:68-1387(-)